MTRIGTSRKALPHWNGVVELLLLTIAVNALDE
jgi:hypothetical protein